MAIIEIIEPRLLSSKSLHLLAGAALISGLYALLICPVNQPVTEINL